MKQRTAKVCAMLALVLAGFFLATSNLAGTPNAQAILSSYSTSGGPALAWTKTYGGGNWSYGHTIAYSMVQTNDEGYAMAGVYNNTIFLIKTDSSGAMQWSKSYGIGGAFGVVQLSDGGYVLGCALGESADFIGMIDRSFNGEGIVWPNVNAISLIKTDSLGNVVWNRIVIEWTPGEDSHYFAQSMVQATDGGFVFAGFVWPESGGYGLTNDDFLLMKADSEGKLQWLKTYGGAGDDEARSVVQTSDGGYALVGYTESYDSLNMNYWLVKTDAAGNMQWAKTYGRHGLPPKPSERGEYEPGDSKAYSVIQTNDGGYAVIGYTVIGPGTGTDILLVKTDPKGNKNWDQTYAVTEQEFIGSEIAYSVAQTGDGGFAIAGSLRTQQVNGPDQIWLIKTTSSGVAEWNQTQKHTETAHGYSGDYTEDTQLEPVKIFQTKDNALAVLGTAAPLQAGDCGYFYLMKTASFLPSPLPPPVPSSEVIPIQQPIAFEPIVIADDGSVSPSTAPIQRNWNVYTFTGNYTGPVIVNKSHIVLDGAGYTLRGNGTFTENDGTQVFIIETQIGLLLTNPTEVTLRNIGTEAFICAIYLNGSATRTAIEGNNLRDSGQYGLGIHVAGNSEKNRIIGNKITGPYNGVVLNNSRNDIISENKLASSGGVSISSGSGSTISSNVFLNSGISLGERCSGTIITGNNLTGGGIYGGTHSIISHNYIGDTWFGISEMANSTIFENNIENTGIGVENSADNVIYHNNFINNTLQAGNRNYKGYIEVMSANKWDNGVEGNYWSDYTEKYPDAKEVGSTGTYDTTYIIDLNNNDTHPLIKPVDVTKLEESLLWIILPIVFVAILTVVPIAIVVKNKRAKSNNHN